MSNPKRIRRSIVVLKLPRSVPALVSSARAIVQAMTGNASFPSPAPPLATLVSALDDLQNAETTTQARTRGTVAARDDQRATVVQLLQQECAYVQTVADANIENGASIIVSAGMSVKRIGVRPPPVFEAKRGEVSGTVNLVAPAAAQRAAYAWESSTDGGKTWIAAPATLPARTTIGGLTPGATVAFRYRPLTKAGEGDWSQPVSIIVT